MLTTNMAWRIEENVIRGEIDNRTAGRVYGKVWLADRNDPLVLELTGNCHKDLAGCRIRVARMGQSRPPRFPVQNYGYDWMACARLKDYGFNNRLLALRN